MHGPKIGHESEVPEKKDADQEFLERGRRGRFEMKVDDHGVVVRSMAMTG